MSSEVSAVVLTIGEKTFDECIQRLNSQTLELDEIIVVRNNFVLHEAYNHGIQQVNSRYFVQCDADMLLDPDCVEVLVNEMKEDTGVSIGYLEDEILGTVQAIKLFRTECVKDQLFKGGVTTDTDCISIICSKGYKISFASRDREKHGHAADVLARHCPNYNDRTYTFGRFMRLGSQVRERHCYDEFNSCLDALKSSTHSMANTAIAAFCHGFFKHDPDAGTSYFDFTKDSPESEQLRRFIENSENDQRVFSVTKIKDLDLQAEVNRFNNRRSDQYR